jgi:hypothetical protein
MFGRRVWVWWLGVSLALAVLFSQLDAGATRGLPMPVAFGVWFAHAAFGLGCAIAATRWIGARAVARRLPPLVRLLFGGLIGSVLFAPVALGLETALPQPVDDPPDGLLDLWEARGGLWLLAAEWLRLLPPYLTSWALLNVVPLRAARRPDLLPSVGPGADPASPDAVASPDAAAPAPENLALPPAATSTIAAADARSGDDAMPGLLARLPPAIGTELIFVQSDLHYLSIRTTRGRATVLGTLAEVEAEWGQLGIRVHRSFWVATAHVRTVKRTANGWCCILSDQTKVPISRRRAGAVKAALGVDFVQETGGA